MDRTWPVIVDGQRADLVITDTYFELRRPGGVQKWSRSDGPLPTYPSHLLVRFSDGSGDITAAFPRAADQSAFQSLASRNDAPAAGSSSGEAVAAQTWKPGDVANGHVLASDLTWVPMTPPQAMAAREVASAATTASTAARTDASPKQTWKPGDIANGHVLTQDGTWVPVASAHDAAALEAYRQQAIAYKESITGWKPLVFWYGFWMIVFAIASISALFAKQFGAFFVSLVITGLLFLYTRYLFNGGTRRVWFIIF